MFKFTQVATLLFFLSIQAFLAVSQAKAEVVCQFYKGHDCTEQFTGVAGLTSAYVDKCQGSTNPCAPLNIQACSCCCKDVTSNGSAASTPVKIDFTPEITVGTFQAGVPIPLSNNTRTIGEYIKQIYSYAIGIVAILAVVVMMIGGVLWMTAGGNQTQVSSAKSWISGSLLGLLLVMGSYVILKTINPDLVNFRTDSIPTVKLPQSQTQSGVDSQGNILNIDGSITCCTSAQDCGIGATCEPVGPGVINNCSKADKGVCKPMISP